MATYTGSFLLVRTQMQWAYTGVASTDEDVRVCTFHNINLEGGAPSGSWPPGDLTLLASYFDQLWTSLKPSYPPALQFIGVRMYLAGPTITPPQEPIFETNVTVPGTGIASSLPPQVAVSVTEKTGARKGWGRFYLPAPAVGNVEPNHIPSAEGRIGPVFNAGFADAAGAMYTAAKGATLPFVIYHPFLPERLTKAGSTLPARPAEAVEVETLQVDDIFDVIRSRRFEVVLDREVRTV